MVPGVLSALGAFVRLDGADDAASIAQGVFHEDPRQLHWFCTRVLVAQNKAVPLRSANEPLLLLAAFGGILVLALILDRTIRRYRRRKGDDVAELADVDA